MYERGAGHGKRDGSGGASPTRESLAERNKQEKGGWATAALAAYDGTRTQQKHTRQAIVMAAGWWTPPCPAGRRCSGRTGGAQRAHPQRTAGHLAGTHLHKQWDVDSKERGVAPCVRIHSRLRVI